MKNKLFVFKIGGQVIDNLKEMESFLKDFAAIPVKKILVHGGGRSVSSMCRRLGLEINMIDGRRITDEDTLEVVKMMLPGVVNKTIVAFLQKYGCNALGFTGADGNTILAKRRPVKNGIDFGFVGDIIQVKAERLAELIELEYTPVFTAMTHDGRGQMLNTNADTIASSLAVALSRFYKTELYYCFEKPGVMSDLADEKTRIPFLSPSLFQSYKNSGAIHSGMIPKIDNAFDALDQGVSRIHICHFRDIGLIDKSNSEIGTLIVNR